ncbi:GRP family sugar transporter [Vagococcus salmoninarum]|uniref:GRP family sugar transporter n=1 Tax=Vagococcus salmoninarum TaxID=2739 RepID=UPI003F99B275
MIYIIALLPALGWGVMPIIAKSMGGSSREQLLGTTLAALAISLIISFIYDIHYATIPVLVSFISGIFWAIGQYFQFKVINRGHVSKVMPLSNGSQLLFTTLVAGSILQEWQTISQGILTTICLFLISISIYLVTKGDKGSGEIKKEMIGLLLCSSLCLTVYVSVTAYFGVTGVQVFLPQAVGMFTCSLLLGKKSSKNIELKKNNIIKNLLTGVSWTVANMSLFYVSKYLGVGFTYSVSQLCVIVSAYFSVLLLKERKSLKELKNMSIGSALYLLAILILSTQK